MSTAKIEIRLPNAPGLWIAAGVVRSGEAAYSATGVGETVDAARASMEAEKAEAAAFGAVRIFDGVGASAVLETAVLHAIQESEERRAVVAWRSGRERPRKPSAAAERAFHEAERGWLVDAERDRRLFFIRETIAIAWSVERAGGGFRFGAACRASAQSAAAAALRELLQMEFGLALICRRRALGWNLAPREMRSLEAATPPTHQLEPYGYVGSRPGAKTRYRLTRKYHTKTGLHIARARPLDARDVFCSAIETYV